MKRDVPSATSQMRSADCESQWPSREDVSCGSNPGVALAATPQAVTALLGTIEAEIIPRLLMLHRRAPIDLAERRSRRVSITAFEIAEFCDLVLQGLEPAAQFVSALIAEGLSRQRLFLELLGPAARRLGDQWTADQIGFTEVTLGLWRLQHLLDQHAARSAPPAPAPDGKRHIALLVAMPGEQHTFGLSMVVEFFRRAGWQVRDDRLPGADAIAEQVGRHRLDLLGISIGGERHLAELRTLVDRCRAVSRNRRLMILLGGPLVAAEPDLASKVGADAASMDVEHAILLAERHVSGREADR